MLIGICDDNELDIIKMEQLCEEYMRESHVNGQCIRFLNGEEVLNYCENLENEKIDILFLDVEMPGINGIELKKHIVKNNLIYRIAFVTNHIDSIYGAFSLKTIGFINKPALKKDIKKMIENTLEELKENIYIDYIGYKGEAVNVPIENILYFEANGSYTKIYIYGQSGYDTNYKMISKKLGQIEETLKEYGFIRAHKSYLVNLANVIDVGDRICIRDYELNIPIGRRYKEQVRKDYLLYGKKKMSKRL